ncbi:conserved Plasmodium protein, unknown function [Plasmodium ovale curtisi]|uniref:RING-type domain-containing protein n=1 Tax=Plasmodium ovale curtisi TaxID=864141 RepID=A0A1A8W1L3_PLAOA|nr:conserved Plasmodium protein, unknown function [Plasmodium ovale curtisi]
MEPGENHKRKYNKHAEVKLEQFKRAALEIIEYKDKIIRMLCAILEVQGTTTVPRTSQGTNNLRALNMSNDKMKSLQKERRKDNIVILEAWLTSHKKRTSSRKRTSKLYTHANFQLHTSMLTSNFVALKKNHELNLFSPPGKLNDELNKEKNFSDSILSSYKLSQNEVSDQLAENIFPIMHLHFLRFPMQYSASIIAREISKRKGNQELSPTDTFFLLFEALSTTICKKKDTHQEGSSNESVQLNTAESDKNFGESRNKELENFENPESNFESTYKPSTPGGMKNDKTSPQEVNQIAGDCQLCLMPNTESLHGNFPPVLYKLSCDHIFHLMCVYETVIRRECRKTCCICHKELSEEDKSYIISRVKREKKENEKKSKLLFKVMKLQAENKD